jgi:hypothetical protein
LSSRKYRQKTGSSVKCVPSFTLPLVPPFLLMVYVL